MAHFIERIADVVVIFALALAFPAVFAQDPDGTVWVGGAAVTYVSGEVEL